MRLQSYLGGNKANASLIVDDNDGNDDLFDFSVKPISFADCREIDFLFNGHKYSKVMFRGMREEEKSSIVIIIIE